MTFSAERTVKVVRNMYFIETAPCHSLLSCPNVRLDEVVLFSGSFHLSLLFSVF